MITGKELKRWEAIKILDEGGKITRKDEGWKDFYIYFDSCGIVQKNGKCFAIKFNDFFLDGWYIWEDEPKGEEKQEILNEYKLGLLAPSEARDKLSKLEATTPFPNVPEKISDFGVDNNPWALNRTLASLIDCYAAVKKHLEGGK